MGERSTLLQRHSDFGFGPVENGHARPLRRFFGNHGFAFGQSRRQHDGKLNSLS